MGENSDIAWTDHTFNPWWGCSKASPGCANCYAETFAKRTGQDRFGDKQRRLFGEKHWSEPVKWAKAARASGKRAKVFCASMGDVFEDRPELVAPRILLSYLILDTADALDWLLLTKRPQNFALMPPGVLEKCWLGVTAEDQARADERIPLLLQAPARVRFVSCEPLLGPVDLRQSRAIALERGVGAESGKPYPPLIDWIIVGGESGPRARPFDLSWARFIRSYCTDFGPRIFIKQLGRHAISNDDDDRRHVGDMMLPHPFRLSFDDLDGRDPAEWPEDLRVQEFPRVESP